jgi:hypothetical protein
MAPATKVTTNGSIDSNAGPRTGTTFNAEAESIKAIAAIKKLFESFSPILSKPTITPRIASTQSTQSGGRKARPAQR